jgi:hypothetical protein
MKRLLITFGGSAYDSVTEKVVNSYQAMGADELLIYDDRWITEQPLWHDETFQWLLSHRGVGNAKGGRGFGWFAWKPYVIADALSRIDDGDMVLYLDGDTYPIANFSILFDECKKIGGHMAFMATARTEPLCNRQWCKRDCFIAMGMDEPRYWNGPHFVARFTVFEKGAAGISHFISQWQRYCLDRHCQTFEQSILGPELDGIAGADGPTGAFREHRTEQAIYTNLCIEAGRKPYREPCEFGAHCRQDWDLYPQLFCQVGLSPRLKSLSGSRFRNVRNLCTVS